MATFARSLAAVAVAAVTLASCTDGPDALPSELPTTSDTPSESGAPPEGETQTPTETPDPETEAIAEIEAQAETYWAAEREWLASGGMSDEQLNELFADVVAADLLDSFKQVGEFDPTTDVPEVHSVSVTDLDLAVGEAVVEFCFGAEPRTQSWIVESTAWKLSLQNDREDDGSCSG